MKNKNKIKQSTFKFEGQSEKSMKYFSLEKKWIETNFNTREKDFYQMLFQRYIPVEDNPNIIISHVSIGSAKTPHLIDFRSYAPAIKYMSSLMMNNSNNQMLSLQKSFIKTQKRVQCFSFYYC